MRLVGYCRVSTENQKEEGTIQVQESELKAFCKENGHELIAVYKDEGVSGDVQNRPGLAGVLSFLENSLNVDGVLIYKLDRLARDLYMQEHVIKELTKLGFKLISTKEHDLDSNDPMRIAFRQFIGITSELEKSYITMRLSAGRMNKARKGGYAGGRAAYGYIVMSDGSLAVNPDQATIVKRILKLRRNKASYHEIARQLNKDAVPSPAGGAWYPGSIKYICENTIYRGTYQYNGENVKNDDLKITGKLKRSFV